ncbi:hypothetical protein ACIGFJ_06755 [Brevundimonas diminuta]|uniref:hypothetical protein n=1 Tax=Brevundimonas diminuta TaxID=293 RepID=UPI0037CCB097
MTADLSALIARLEAAEAGSRELDWRIAEAFDIPEPWKVAVRIWPPFMERSKFDQAIPAFTTSLDAALALAERIGMDGFRVMYAALMSWKAHDPRGPLSQTLPLALCIATLRAKLDGYAAEGEVNKNPKAQEG